ncbi:hypothetical protein L195_g047041, partial [Trifolium pratense]
MLRQGAGGCAWRNAALFQELLSLDAAPWRHKAAHGTIESLIRAQVTG